MENSWILYRFIANMASIKYECIAFLGIDSKPEFNYHTVGGLSKLQALCSVTAQLGIHGLHTILITSIMKYLPAASEVLFSV